MEQEPSPLILSPITQEIISRSMSRHRGLRAKLLSLAKDIPKGDSPEGMRAALSPWRLYFVKKMFERKPYLLYEEDRYLAHLASVENLKVEKVTPILVQYTTREEYDLYDYFRMFSSFPVFDRPGRRMKFLVRDVGQPSSPLIGICCLSSVMRQMQARDAWIGWDGPEWREVRAHGLAYMMDLSTCVSLPPYSYVAAGKLVAAATASNEIRAAYESRYAARNSLFYKRVITDFVLLTTAGAYGRNAPQYKGMKLNNSSLFKFIGYTKGYSMFHITPDLYDEIKDFVRKRRGGTDPTVNAGPNMLGGSNAKVRILRFAARALRIPEESLVFSGHKRAIFVAPLAANWREVLLGREEQARYFDWPIASIIETWKNQWLLRRLNSPAVMQNVNQFNREMLRFSRLL